jgi:hypothetical protein
LGTGAVTKKPRPGAVRQAGVLRVPFLSNAAREWCSGGPASPRTYITISEIRGSRFRSTKLPPTLKRVSASRASGIWQDEDYDVLVDGKVVGRIYENASVSAPPDMRWFWSVTAIAPATAGVTNGTAATRVETLAKFRAAWDQYANR